jgi:hypothetical protein
MKKLIIFQLFSALIFFGCNQESEITSPEQSVQTQGPNWIALPNSEGLRVNTIYTATKTINGFTGGTIKINESYMTPDRKRVSISASLKFPKNAFEGTREVTMALDQLYGDSEFSPAGSFNLPALYNANFMGLDLTGVNPANVEFVYIAENGSVEIAENDGIVVDLVLGKLQVTNAKLPHFSRYGFVN